MSTENKNEAKESPSGRINRLCKCLNQFDFGEQQSKEVVEEIENTYQESIKLRNYSNEKEVKSISQIMDEKKSDAYHRATTSIILLLCMTEESQRSEESQKSEESKKSKILKYYAEPIAVAFDSIKKQFPATKDIAKFIDTIIVMFLLKNMSTINTELKTLKKEVGINGLLPMDLILGAINKMEKNEDLELLGKKFPSYSRLDEDCKGYIKKGVIDFLISQFVQAEIIPINLKDVEKFLYKSNQQNEKEKNDYIINLNCVYSLFNLASRKKALTPQSLSSYLSAFESIRRLTEIHTSYGDSCTDVYIQYLHKRGRLLNLNAYNASTQRALIRICCMTRLYTKDKAKSVVEAFSELSIEDKQILRKELGATGFEKEKAMWIYFSPDFLYNCNEKDRMKYGLQCMAKCYQLGREKIKERVFESNIIKLDIKSLVEAEEINVNSINSRWKGNDLEIFISSP